MKTNTQDVVVTEQLSPHYLKQHSLLYACVCVCACVCEVCVCVCVCVCVRVRMRRYVLLSAVASSLLFHVNAEYTVQYVS